MSTDKIDELIRSLMSQNYVTPTEGSLLREIERLRAAMQKILNTIGDPRLTMDERLDDCGDIAREAWAADSL